MDYIANKNEKIIKFLIHNIQGISFANAQKMLRMGNVRLNGKKVRENVDIAINDIITVYNTHKSMPKVDILYSDDNILIVNKPQGIECATRDKSSSNTYSLEEILSEYSPIVVHRIDRLTEGLVILARNIPTARKFEKYFESRAINKFYMATVWGTISNGGIKTAYLKKDASNSIVQISDKPKENFKEIITEYKVIKNQNNCTLLDIKLHTGRTHQIRAYFAHIEHPILNDSKYGRNQTTINEYKGYFLTSYKIQFNIHPDDSLSYLNNLNIEIKPSWIDLIDDID